MGGRGQRKDKTTQRFMQALLGVTLAANANPPPAVPAEAKLAKDLYSQFINKGKRAKAWKELEALQKSKPSSALCITAAKMHMIAAVEQVCKAEEDAAREELALHSMHSVLDCACQGALAFASLQCLVLAVFTLHTCRGRGSAEQLAWRRQQAAALEARFGGLASSAARWAKTKWVDPRIESYEKDRFPFEWEPYSSKNLREWVEAVRDDWNKFMPTIARADQLAAERAGAQAAITSSSGSSRDATSSSSSGAGSAGREGSLAGPPSVAGPDRGWGGAEGHDALGEDMGSPVDVRLAGSFALKHCDKEAIRRHLDALEAKRKPGSTAGALAAPLPPPSKPAPTPASTRAGRAATAAAAAAVVQLAAAAGKEERGNGLGCAGLTSGPAALPPPPAPYSRGGLGADNTSFLPPYQHPAAAAGVGKGRERHRAEQKRQQAQRAQQRAAEIQAYLAQQLEPAGDDPEAAQQLLADRCRMQVDEFGAAVRAALAAKEISQAEADLAFANLGRLQGYDGGPPHHVWYGDSHLDIGDRRHEVEGQQEMEDTLTEQLQQDWVIAEEATEWVGSHLDGWRELLARMGLEANTMTDVDRDSMLAQEDPSLGQTLVRVWTEDYPAPPPEGVGAEVDLAADAELEALLPAGARPCSCGRCQREQQQAAASGSITSDSSSSGAVRGKEASSDGSAAVVGQEAQPAAPPTRSLQGGAAAAAAARRLNGTAEVFTAAEQCQAGEFAAAGGAGGSPSRVQLAQQQWREAMHSEEYGSVLQLDVYINEAERSQQYLDSILGRPEGLMQQCRVLAANPEGAPSNEADELVRRAVVGHLMLRLAGAWDDASAPPPQQQQGEEAANDSGSQGVGASTAAPAAPRAGAGRASVTQTLHLLRRAMDPSCDLESLIMDCAVDEEAGRCAVAKLGQLREAELAAEAAASKAWAELAAAMQTQEGAAVAGGPSGSSGGSSSRGTEPVVAGLMSSMASRELGAVTAACPGGVAAAEVAAGVDAREDDGAISRPVTFCTPLLTTVLEGAVGAASSSQQPSCSASSSSGSSCDESSYSESRAGQQGQGPARAPAAAASASEHPPWEAERARLVRLKGQLARSALMGLGQIWRRRRLTDKMSFQLCQFIADSLATCGELSSREPEREVLRRAAERLLVGPAPAPCVLRLAGWLPLRVLRHLYTFVVLLVGECFASPQDLSEEVEDLVYADASAGALSEDGTTVTVRPAVFAALMPVQPPGAQSPYIDPTAMDPTSSRRKRPGSSSGSRGELFGALAPAYSLQSVPDMAGPLALLDPLGAAAGTEGAGSNWLARVAAYVCTPVDAQHAQQEGGRDEVVGDLHKLWHVEGVLLGLANLCEYWERGLDDSLARMEGLRATLGQIVAGGKDTPEASAELSKGPFMLEQQLLEARKVLQATEAVELSLRLAVIKMHGVCFEDVLGMLKEQPAELDIKDKACTAAAISKFECMLRDSSAEGEACRARMQELAVAPAPQLEGKEQETVRALGLVLGGNPASQNGQHRTSQQKIRALLAARTERWEASLTAGRELVLGTLRRLDECTEALATLGEWCYIKQCSLIGQLRSQYCTHSCGDEMVGVLLRVLASQRWEPAILAEQERERSARAQQLESELEREREREAQVRAAKKAQRARQRAQELAMFQQQQPQADTGEATGPSANGAAAQDIVGSEGGSSGGEDGSDSEAAAVVPTVAEPTMRQGVGAGGEGDWVADLLARQQVRPQTSSVPAAAPAHPAAVLKATKQQGAAERKKQAQQQPREVMRIVSYQGDWLCSCGQVNRLRDPCPSCGQMEPCRDWVRGICDFPQCRFPHPPFDLPATTHVKKSARIANPAPDAPIYGQPLAAGAAAAAAAKQPAAGQQHKRAPESGGGGASVPPQHTLAAHISAAAAAVAAAKANTVPSANGGGARSLSSARNSSSGSLASAGGGALHAPAELAGGPHSNAWGLPPPTFAAAVASSGSAGSRDPTAAATAVTAAAVERSPAWSAKPQPLANGSLGGSTGSAATSGRASPAFPPAGSRAAGGAAVPLPVGPAAEPAAAGPGPPVSGVSHAAAPLSAFASAPVAGHAAHQHANGLRGMPAAHYAAAEAGVRQAPGQPVWGSQVLAAQQPLPSQQPLPPQVLQHEQGVNGLEDDAELDEAYFTAFNSQLLQGLGLGEVEDFSSMPSTDLSPHRAPTPPPSLPAGAPGAHNTYLSAIVRCLWYCEEFREEVRSWPWTVYTAHPVVKALYALFHALAEGQQSGRSQGKAGAAQQQPRLELGPLDHLNAAELEQALPGPLLAAGSAGEVLLAMYERVQEVAAMRALPMLADIVFGIPLGEVVQCRACGRVTQQAAYMQYLLTMQACALREEQQRLGGESASLGRLLRLAADQQKRPCDKAAGGCGALNSVSQVLRREPRVFTLQLAWPTQLQAAQDYNAMLDMLQEQVDLADLYTELAPRQFVYRLRCMLCCDCNSSDGSASGTSGGGHRVLVLAPEHGGWMLVEEDAVTCLGTAWADVLVELRTFQPLLLFYHRA